MDQGIGFLVRLVFLRSYTSASGGMAWLHGCGKNAKSITKKILIEGEASQIHALIQIGSIPLKFVMCHAHNRHATEMTKMWLK